MQSFYKKYITQITVRRWKMKTKIINLSLRIIYPQEVPVFYSFTIFLKKENGGTPWGYIICKSYYSK